MQMVTHYHASYISLGVTLKTKKCNATRLEKAVEEIEIKTKVTASRLGQRHLIND